MSRGDHQEAIYRDDADRKRFLETLEECCGKTGWMIHAYVLMGNHYHLLLETPEPNLVTGMKWFQGVYTQRFNGRHKLFGHLFQGRYKALVVEPEGEYFATVGTYIHLNPARAGLVSPEAGGLAKYRWSSFPQYLMAPRKRPHWLATSDLFSAAGIGREDAGGRRRFEAWADAQALACASGDAAALDREWQKIRRGWYLGGETFKEKLMRKIGEKLTGRQGDSQSGGAKRGHGETAAEEWLSKAGEVLGMTQEEMQHSKKGDDRKQVLAWGLRSQFTVTCKWAASRLNMGDPSRIGTAVRHVQSARKGPLVKLRRTVEKLNSAFRD
jgi:putative transposase